MDLYIKRPFHIPDFRICNANEVVATALRLQYGKYISEDKLYDTHDIDAAKWHENILYEIDTIIYENTVYDESILALHGSAVEWNGKAYAFLAATESGKTTLTSYLTGMGLGYITDDCVLIDRNSLMVYPYTCPVHLRDGGLAVLDSLGKRPSSLQFLDDEIMRRYIYTPQNCVEQPLPLGGIFFIQRSEAENTVVELHGSEKMILLMQSPITPYDPSPEYIELFARLGRFKCEKLVYKDMDFVGDIVKKVSCEA